MRLLITGFEPFDDQSINPSFEAVNLLPDKINDIDIYKVELPVTFDGLLEKMDSLIEAIDPDYVICVGQAGGRGGMSFEKVAINLMNSISCDNLEKPIVDKKINALGPCAYFANIPVRAMASKVKNAGIPASVSYTAGTYVCNYVMYGVLDLIDRKYKKIKGGFIHVPFLPEQTIGIYKDLPSLELSRIVQGLIIAIDSINANNEINENEANSFATIC